MSGNAITEVGYAVPRTVVANAAIAVRLAVDAGWIGRRTGTRERRVIAPGFGAGLVWGGTVVEWGRVELHDADKRAAAERAASLVEDGMRVGLGTGTTVAPLLGILAARGLRLSCVATSPATELAARAAGLNMVPFTDVAALDIAIDGADQIGPGPWLVKGGGRAHTREKVVAAAARRFVVIASGEKAVERIHAPVPVELLAFGLSTTLARLAHVQPRGGPLSPDGGLIADWVGPVEDPAVLARRLDGEPGVVGHGLFGPELVSDVIIAGADGVEHRRVGAPPR